MDMDLTRMIMAALMQAIATLGTAGSSMVMADEFGDACEFATDRRQELGKLNRSPPGATYFFGFVRGFCERDGSWTVSGSNI
jgi:hypothetical protein